MHVYVRVITLIPFNYILLGYTYNNQCEILAHVNIHSLLALYDAHIIRID